MRKAKTLKHHEEHSCKWTTPPGKLIYEDKRYSDGTFKGISAYMIDGRDDKLYCQNLSLMAFDVFRFLDKSSQSVLESD